jgi:hypothetical protein
MTVRDPYEAAEAPLKAKKQQLLGELASIDAALAGIARAREMSAGAVTVGSSHESRPVEPQLPPETSPYYGQSIGEASFSVLTGQPPKHPLTPREVALVLKRARFEIAHKNPVHAIHTQLKRRAEKHGDVLLVGVGKWGLRKWYTPAEIDQLVENLGGMGGRDRESHIERTRVGMAAARSRGVVLGAKPKIDDAMKARIQEKAARKGAEKMTLQEIADSERIALSSIFAVFKGGRKGILKWKAPRTEDRPADLLTPVAGNA